MNNSKLSKVGKLFHLNSKTIGDAKDIVSKTPLTNESFENKRILVNSQLRKLFSLPSISTKSDSTIKKIQSDINSSLSVLRMYNVDISN